MIDSVPVSVVMPVLNEEGHLAAAVESVLEQDFEGELLLALGPSTDKTNEIAEELAKKDGRIRLVPNPRGLTTVGMNLAIKQAKYDYIVRIDAHSEPQSDYIQRGVHILNEVGADLIGGVMAARGKTLFQKAVAWGYTSRIGLGGGKYHLGGEAGETDSAYLGIFRKSALERVGGYDENIIRGEDWELAQRIKKTGGLVWFSPELRVTYWPRANWIGLSKQFFSTGVWRGDLTRRDMKSANLRYFLPPVMVASVVLGLILAGLGLEWGIAPALVYLAAVLVALRIESSNPWAIVVIPTMHFSWGWGFIVGFLFGARGKLDRSRVTK